MSDHAPDAALLRVQDVAKDYGELPILSGITFELAPGRCLAVHGPNGVGKTTLLRCVVGSEQVDHGEILLDGRPYDEADPACRAATASALDDPAYFVDLTVAEHLHLVAWAHGDTTPDRTVATVLDETGLTVARDHFPVALSAGQRRRLALASCFARPRRLLVLDEPEQHLDDAGRRWLVERLIIEKQANVGVLLTSHDRTLLDAVADDILELA